MRSLGLILWLLVPTLAGAQTVLLQAGDSSLFQSSGGGARIYNPDGSVINFGIGTVNSGPLLFGGNVAKPFDGFMATAGDLQLPFTLDTDSYAGYGFLARGFLVAPKDAEVLNLRRSAPIVGGLQGHVAAVVNNIFRHCKIFGGVDSTGFSAPWFQASRAFSPLGYANCKARLTEHLTVSEMDAFSNRQTVLTSLSWSASGLTFAGTGGVGDNSPYGAVLAKYENAARTLDLKVSYIAAQDRFRRVLLTAPLISENVGLNANAAWLVTKSLRVTGSHQHLLSPVLNAPSISATLNSEGAFYQLGRMNFHAANYSSTALGVKNSGQDFGSELRLANGISLREEYLRSKNNDVIISSVRERFRHFEFTENYTRSTSTSQGQTASTNSFDGGVSYIGNGYSASLEYEEEYFPLVPAGQSPFKRVLSLSLSKTVRDAVISAQSYVTPQNRMKFSVQGSDYLYGKPVENERHISAKHVLDKFIVQGIVVEIVEGQRLPVFGAAVQVDGQVTYTGFDGRFFLRFPKSKTFPVCVLVEHFLQGSWHLVSAPATATAYLEAQSQFIEIIVKRDGGQKSSSDCFNSSLKTVS
jgi:hypothetical protein